MTTQVASIGMMSLIDDPGLALVGGIGGMVMVADEQPAIIGMLGVQILMDAQVDPTLKPESGAFLQIQKI